MFKHIMIDIETLSTDVDAIICAIGACAFNPFTKVIDIDNSFYFPIAWAKQLEYRHLSVDTCKWWLSESTTQLAKNELLIGVKTLPTVLHDFKAWCYNYDPEGKNLIVWSKSSMFDFPILHHAFKQAAIFTPWSFRNVRDSRTIVELVHDKDTEFEFSYNNINTPHNALNDVIKQIHDVIDSYSFLNLYPVTKQTQ